MRDMSQLPNCETTVSTYRTCSFSSLSGLQDKNITCWVSSYQSALGHVMCQWSSVMSKYTVLVVFQVSKLFFFSVNFHAVARINLKSHAMAKTSHSICILIICGIKYKAFCIKGSFFMWLGLPPQLHFYSTPQNLVVVPSCSCPNMPRSLLPFKRWFSQLGVSFCLSFPMKLLFQLPLLAFPEVLCIFRECILS